MKILACLVNHGTRQLWALDKLLLEYFSMGYDVDIIIHSNIPLDRDYLKEKENYEITDEVEKLYKKCSVQVYTELEDPNWLPHQTRKTIYDRRNLYDIYIYSENDHLITKQNIDLFNIITSVLPENKICGLFQYEYYSEIPCKVYPGAHAHYGWDFNSISTISNTNFVFASYSNPHQASYILTNDQLNKVIREIDFMFMDFKSGFTIKCTANTDIYLKPKWDKVLCISHWDDMLVNHLPNRYLRNLCVRDTDFHPIIIEMVRQIRRMRLPFKYDENGNQINNYSMNLHQYFED